MPDTAATEATRRRHRFNDRFFCDECGVDAIGLQWWGPQAMVCDGTNPKMRTTIDADRATGDEMRA